MEPFSKRCYLCSNPILLCLTYAITFIQDYCSLPVSSNWSISIYLAQVSHGISNNLHAPCHAARTSMQSNIFRKIEWLQNAAMHCSQLCDSSFFSRTVTGFDIQEQKILFLHFTYRKFYLVFFKGFLV